MSEQDDFWANFAAAVDVADAAAIARADAGRRTGVMTGRAEQAAQRQANEILDAEIRRRAEAQGLVWDPVNEQWLQNWVA